MKRFFLIAGALLLALVTVMGVIAWNIPADKAIPTDAVQVSREAGGNEAITVSVSRAGEGVLQQPGIGPDLSAMAGRVLPFAIALDTHAGDISTLELNGKVFLRDATGVEIPAMIKQLSSSSHHTTYVAVFPKLDSRGQSLADAANRHLTLLVKGVGSVPERALRWDLGGPAAAWQSGAAAPGAAGATAANTGSQRLLTGLVALLAVLGGFLALMSPCMLHTASYWAALVTSASTKAEVVNNTPIALRKGVLKTVLLYIGGFTLMYAVLGTIAGAVGSLASQTLTDRLAPYKLVMDIIAGLLMTVFGLHVTGLLRSAWVHRLRVPLPRFLMPKLQVSEQPAAFSMGLSMALGCVSCVGGTVFLGLLAYLGTTTWLTGLQVSLLYSLGLATPLLLLTFGLGGWLTRLRANSWLRIGIAGASGAMLMVVGVLTLIGQGELVEAGLFWMVAKLGSSGLTAAQHLH